MKNQERITKDVKIEKDGDNFVSVLRKEYDYSDKGYYTTVEQRQTILDKSWVEEEYKRIKEDFEKIEGSCKANDEYLDKIKENYSEKWASKDFQNFLKKYEKKIVPMLKLKEKYDEYHKKSNENEIFKTQNDINKEFLEHYEKMLEEWNKDDTTSN